MRHLRTLDRSDRRAGDEGGGDEMLCGDGVVGFGTAFENFADTGLSDAIPVQLQRCQIMYDGMLGVPTGNNRVVDAAFETEIVGVVDKLNGTMIKQTENRRWSVV